MSHPPYSRYAAVYDRTGQSRFSLHAWERAGTVLAELGWRGESVLELACGTGALAARMTAQGYRVVAADLSRDMLLCSRCRGETVAFPAVCCDLRALAFAPASFDLVTSFYDSMNYLLTVADLKATLKEVARVLRPGGMFVFDLNTPYTLAEHWRGLCDARSDREVATIWRAHWESSRQISSLQATFFVRAADGRYDRFDETHDERGFSDTELKRAFRAARLRLLRAEDVQTRARPVAHSRRIFYFLGKLGDRA